MSAKAETRGICWDPYAVWRTLILGNPDLLLRSNTGLGLSDRSHAMHFALTIADLPDDLQDFLFVLAQEYGADAAHNALDDAVRQFFQTRAVELKALAKKRVQELAKQKRSAPPKVALVPTPASISPEKTQHNIFCRSRG